MSDEWELEQEYFNGKRDTKKSVIRIINDEIAYYMKRQRGYPDTSLWEEWENNIESLIKVRDIIIKEIYTKE